MEIKGSVTILFSREGMTIEGGMMIPLCSF